MIHFTRKRETVMRKFLSLTLIAIMLLAIFTLTGCDAILQIIQNYSKIDAAALTNQISTDTIRGVVTIYNKSYNSFLGLETAYSTKQGSGFCFHIEDGYYFILTNCHVAEKDPSYDKQKFTIEDYQGNTYEGSLFQFKNANEIVSAISPSYDLACLYFKASSTNVKQLDIVTQNPNINSDVISLGAPEGQANAITFGKITGYGKVTLPESSPTSTNVTFDVIGHNAYINNGSSGGPLLNADLNVVGVNYAGSSTDNFGAAIPAEKIIEFLEQYVFK